MHALVVSPFSSHPLTQGNAVRIDSICRMLKAHGYWVHFLHYPLDGSSKETRAAMSRAWDFLYRLPGDLPNTLPTLTTHYGIDDWWDPAIGRLARQLDATWHYDVCVVNYVWFSAVLDALPRRVLKVIDAHDVFADRHVRAVEAGMAPNWFYTSPAEEARGLGRADVVLAIQDEEARHFNELGLPHVETVGHITEARFLPPRRRGERLRVGYIGSGNPWNVRAIEIFHAKLAARPALAERLELVLAGPICAKAASFNTLFKPLGIVPDVVDFYRDVDLVVNPMVGGTGLKIKTIEALSYGVPVLSTRDGSVGVASAYPEHKLETVEAVLDAVAAIDAGTDLAPRSRASRSVFAAYLAEQLSRFHGIFATPPQEAANVFMADAVGE